MTGVGDSNMPSVAEIIARHQVSVWRYLRLLGCDAATADDLTQETFLALLKQTDFQYSSAAATAVYLRRVAHNLYVSWLRRRKPTQPLLDHEACEMVWGEWTRGDDEQQHLLSILRDCLAQLTPRAQQALRLRFEDASRRTDIGAALGITEHGAKNLMQRAKQQLRECVQAKLETKPPID